MTSFENGLHFFFIYSEALVYNSQCMITNINNALTFCNENTMKCVSKKTKKNPVFFFFLLLRQHTNKQTNKPFVAIPCRQDFPTSKNAHLAIVIQLTGLIFISTCSHTRRCHFSFPLISFKPPVMDKH